MKIKIGPIPELVKAINDDLLSRSEVVDKRAVYNLAECTRVFI